MIVTGREYLTHLTKKIENTDLIRIEDDEVYINQRGYGMNKFIKDQLLSIMKSDKWISLRNKNYVKFKEDFTNHDIMMFYKFMNENQRNFYKNKLKDSEEKYYIDNDFILLFEEEADSK